MTLHRATAPGCAALPSGRPGAVVFAVLLWLLALHLPAQQIKSIIYDFDGFDLGATAIPEGDYSYGDLTYKIAAPGVTSPVLGDRCLQLDIAWNAGYAAFGRGISRFVELSQSQDRLNFFFQNALANAQSASVTVIIADDDNQDKSNNTADDDSWRASLTIPTAAGWQLVSVPLSDFSDNNTGGNGTFDIGFSASKGMFLLVEFKFSKPSGATVNPTFLIDFISLTEGTFPHGTTALELPPKQNADHCMLGAHQAENPGEYYLIPQHFEGQFPADPNKRLRYVNSYMQWASNGSTQPHMLPGQGYQTLLTNGYRPIITWEPSFSGHGILDPAQPSLDEIIAGNYDTYIDDFADKLKGYNDTIIVRLMHEFDGDWYPWCIANNQQDPQKFVQAWKRIVDRVRNKGAGKVQWMWCPNNSFTPQEHWNWVVSAYPGDSYVDIVATDVYNAHYPQSLPWWRSFRWQTAEIYYYLTKYFPAKPFMICELACRERTSGEAAASQSKADWFAAMDKDLQSYFKKTRGLIFFNETKGQSWALNSSTAALNSIRDNIWADSYYFGPGSTALMESRKDLLAVYPNPATSDFVVRTGRPGQLFVSDARGLEVLTTYSDGQVTITAQDLSSGVYVLRFVAGDAQYFGRIVIQ